MLGSLSFFRYLRGGDGRLSAALVFACALALAYFCGRTFFAPFPKTYPADFATAQWVSSSNSPQGYFRKSLYVTAEITHAWVQIAAPDTYELYVNDDKVHENTFNKACVTGLYDLKPFLRQGKNIIAVHVSRISFPGPAQILVRGSYTAVNSPPQEFYSDTAWKVSGVPDGIVGGISWRSPELDDSSWTNANPAPKDGRPSTILPLRFPPQLLQRVPSAAWIGPPDTRALLASFRAEIKVPNGRVDTWLRIAATGSYDVLINGKLLLTEPMAPASDPRQRKGALKLSAYNISSFVRHGNNTVLVRVRSETGSLALLVDGATFGGNAIESFSTDGTWEASLRGGDSETNRLTRAVVLGRYGDSAWPTSQDNPTNAQPLAVSDFRALLLWSLVVLATSCLILFLWVAASILCSAISDCSPEQLWSADAIIHFCLMVVLLLLLLLTFDIRLPRDWCFTPSIVLGAFSFLVGSKLLLLLCRPRQAIEARRSGSSPPPAARLRWFLPPLLVLMFTGCFIRASHLSDISFDVDEISVIQYCHGIFVNGIPHVHLGSFVKRATTYELLEYPLAAARLFFGPSESALRLPALVFSTMTIGLLGWFGYRVFDWRAGIISALIYTLHPACIYWSRNAFWPSQAQFLVLLTVWCFYEAILTQPFRRGFLTAAAAGFLCSYLTWEGSGFVLPALFVAMLAARPGQFDWLKDWHLWRCFFVMTVVVLLQLCHRQLSTLPTYLQTGSGLADVSTPQIVYLDPTKFDPSYYLKIFATIECNYTLTLIFVCGLPFCWRDRRLRFLMVIILTLLISYSWFLPAYSVRYAYHYQTLLILASVGMILRCLDRVAHLATTTAALAWPAPVGALGSGLAVLTLLLATNEELVQSYRLSSNPAAAYFAMRTGLNRSDYRGAAQFVKERVQPGDVLIVPIPHVFEYYSHLKADYSLNTLLSRRISYDGARDIPRFVDRFKAIPSLQNVEDLQYVHTHAPRVWLVLVPFNSDSPQSPEVEAYLAANQKVVYESYRARVILLDGAQQFAPGK